ncbi:hypothetical protein G6F31_013784 [Rhizopus arrhizus]|nr:hypothetical protein G6F31_013784 [Rhizopus arrhizus]
MRRAKRDCISSLRLNTSTGACASRGVADAAQCVDLAALHRLVQGGHRAQHGALAQQLHGVVLVLHAQVQGGAGALRELRGGLREPGLQAVVVHRHRNAGLGQVLVGQAHPVQRVVFEQGGLFGQLHQYLALGGGGGRGAALDQQAADPVLQRLDPLRDGRRGDIQRLRGAVEAAFADHRGQGAQLGMVDTHRIKFR